MKRILYLMHVPWGWIKQRPHFLAEELSRHFEVQVVYRQPFDARRLVKNPVPGTLRVRMLNILPFNRFRWIARLNARYLNLCFSRTIGSFDVVWLTSPEMYETVETALPAGCAVVYDCMDNQLEFAPVLKDPRRRAAIAAAEKRVVHRATAVLASSATLERLLRARYGMDEKIHVVNNGVFLGDAGTGEAIPAALQALVTSGSFLVTYVGTIAEWFDLELVVETVARYPRVTVVLCGPVEVAIPKHERIVVLGPVAHGAVFPIMAVSQLLIMPFRLTELVRGVDPVKLYEYVYSGRPVLALRYAETEKFAEFISLYEDRAEYFARLEAIMANGVVGRRSAEECRAFADTNTWEKRVAQIVRIIGEP